MVKKNSTWKIIATVGGFIIIVIGAAVTYGVLSEKVSKMEPDVKLNTEHRIKFEEKINNMEKNIEQILVEVQKK